MSFSKPYKINIIKAKRRTVSIAIEKNGEITVRSPRRVTGRQLDDVLASKKQWIERKVREMERRQKRLNEMSADLDLNEKDVKKLKKQARAVLERKTEEIAREHELSYGKIRLSSARRRWGSCSVQNNLSFNWKIIFAPDDVIDYLVVHELAHTVHKNHQKSFWSLVEKIHPQHKKARKWLKENSHIIDVA